VRLSDADVLDAGAVLEGVGRDLDRGEQHLEHLCFTESGGDELGGEVVPSTTSGCVCQTPSMMGSGVPLAL
jgi:hypothetical protein